MPYYTFMIFIVQVTNSLLLGKINAERVRLRRDVTEILSPDTLKSLMNECNVNQAIVHRYHEDLAQAGLLYNPPTTLFQYQYELAWQLGKEYLACDNDDHYCSRCIQSIQPQSLYTNVRYTYDYAARGLCLDCVLHGEDLDMDCEHKRSKYVAVDLLSCYT